jgi:transcriptional regulator with XRE-family HTH domain
MAKAERDPLMDRAKQLFEQSGLTLDALGDGMGAEKATARMSAWQFLNRTSDPRLSMLRRFAKSVGISLEELVAGKEQRT